MKETSKAMRRRIAEPTSEFPWVKIFEGDGIDVGSGDDPLAKCGYYISDSNKAWSHDLPDGAGDSLLQYFSTRKFQWLTASHVAEHAINPETMIKSWIACLNPKGFIVFTVPDFRTYEGLTFPSLHNAGHRSTWSLDIETSPALHHCKLPEWLARFEGVKILRCELILTNYDPSLDPKIIDQTYDFEKGVECCIEVVLQKE